MLIHAEHIIRFIELAAERIKQHRDELTELDAQIGDADHGTNLDRGFSAVLAKLPSLENEDIGTILRNAGLTLLSTVGGAAGPLYGTAFMRAGAVLEGRRELTPADILAAAEAALEGVVARGKARRGEKTVVDALEPAVDALREAFGRDEDLIVALRSCIAAAEAGMLATIPMEATKGRARFLGERSIGHQDPGATSTFYIVQAFLEVAEKIGEREG